MTFHLHIRGRVQGIGFRPHVYKLAIEKKLHGYVANEADGVHVFFNVNAPSEASSFSKLVIENAPSNAIIRNWNLSEVPPENFSSFSIRVFKSAVTPDLLIAPDFAMCNNCRSEFHDPGNRRYQYPFITCTICGPRYSITERLPYERHLTTMKDFSQCPGCLQEYNDPADRRYFSQTNSCPQCGIQFSWHEKNNATVEREPRQILVSLKKALQDGATVAVKGIGGFLLLCNASDREALSRLRSRKHRPLKPFAVLFPDMESVFTYTNCHSKAADVLAGEAAPIVLLLAKETCYRDLDMQGIAPGLQTIGVMIPYAPILEWIISGWQKPLIATSGNLSGSSIVFQSNQKEELFRFADFILDNNRDIVVPQDDSVVRFAEKSGQKILMRRARGFAPALLVDVELDRTETIFAAGAMLKSSFANQQNGQIYLSQFLGNLESYDAQQSYLHTYDHFSGMLKASPGVVLSDLHPDYPSTQIAKNLSEKNHVPLKKVQHHEAHFAAILGEHNLFRSSERVLGVIWDGTGLGSDGNIWGGEFFIYDEWKMKRIHFLEPFIHMAGDKMAAEPRLAALAMSHHNEKSFPLLRSKFSDAEWNFYQKAVRQPGLNNTSAGRYFDGVAALLNLVNKNSYEGEAALTLEQAAGEYLRDHDYAVASGYFTGSINHSSIPMKNIINGIIDDLQSGITIQEIAAVFHNSLVAIITEVARKEGVRKVVFSGGVFQNSVLVDLLNLQVGQLFQLYFHHQMPPNDENIAFGQLMHYQNIKS